MENRNEIAECLCENGSNNGCVCSNTNIIKIITISVQPTTGGQFQLSISKTDSIENLKKLISKKLKVPKERICLLYRERQLREGTVEDNQLVDGSRLTLLPSVETGLLAQRPEQSVMQALESLNDSQVNDFLSGKAPLNLTMRLGDHMMLIQLQLSTVAPGPTGSSTSSSSSSTSGDSSSTSSISSVSSRNVSNTTNVIRSQCDCVNSQQVSSSSNGIACKCDCSSVSPNGTTLLDTRALAEASRNLTQTLKQLSSEVLTSKSEHSTHEGLGRRQGAIIESMHHHGKGVYSGTFSGTLNPALQDKFGRPKRDISTIIHILNDLLCATPQYRAASSALSAAAASSQLTALSSHDGSHNTNILSSQPIGTISHSISTSQSTNVLPNNTTSNQQHPIPSSRISSESSNISSMELSQCPEESVENRATRGKMERLRLVLGQRRERRRAMRSRPYATPSQSNATTTPHPTPPTPDSVTA